MNGQPLAALSIAGLDPCGGAGLLADIKTFEQFKVLGLGVCSSLTYQNDEEFVGLKWVSLEEIREQLLPLTGRFNIKAVKFGLIERPEIIANVKHELRGAHLVWDPIMRASAGFRFRSGFNLEALKVILKRVTVFTPNLEEMSEILPEIEPLQGAIELSQFCPVYLKGGHAGTELVTDYFVSNGEVRELSAPRIQDGEKHGSGCVLSAAITAGLVQGMPTFEACEAAQMYVRKFLASSSSLMGFHS